MDVRQRQIALWRDLLEESKCFLFDFNDHPVFINKRIDRKVGFDLFKAIGDSLFKTNQVQWISETRFIFMSKPLDAYADELYQWADQSGSLNTIETLFHIMENSKGFSFNGAPEQLIISALKRLESRGKCSIIKSKANDGAEHIGVKFFH